MVQGIVEFLIISTTFDHKASMVHRCAIAFKKSAGIRLGKTAGHVRKIHRHLPRERNAGPAAGSLPQQIFFDVEAPCDSCFDKFPEF